MNQDLMVLILEILSAKIRLRKKIDLSAKIKDWAYIINFDEPSNIGTHWVALYASNNDVMYFDSFEVEHIPKKLKNFISNKSIKINIFRIQA